MKAPLFRTSVVIVVGFLSLAAQPGPLCAQASQGFNFPTVVGIPNMFIFPENAFMKEGTCNGPAGPGGNCAGVPEGTLGDYAGFGFTIPAQAQILGIEVFIGGDGGELPDEPVLALLDPQGEPVGQPKSVSMPAFTYQEEVAGSPSDTWGFPWTPAQVNALDFGVRIADVDVPGGFRLDYVAIRVHYGPMRPAIAQRPRYSVAPSGPSGCDPADILVQPGSGFSPCGAPGSPEVLIPCAALTFPGSCSGPLGAGPPLNDDVTALTFGHEIGAGQLFFSVAPLAQGCPGTAVEDHHLAGHPQGDEFQVTPDPVESACGDNTVFYTAAELGLQEEAGGVVDDDDDLDALAWPGTQPYFTLAPGSPTLAILGAASSDILTTPVPGQGPVVSMSHVELGLSADDVIDALCLGSPGSGEVIFSLAPGSPSLLATGYSPGDLLLPGPALLGSAASLGLAGDDDLDAVKCALDCNANGTVDSDEVAQGTAQDSNADGLLDECEDPPPDFSACGTLVAMGGCLFLELPSGEIYYVQNTTGFQAGAQVLVEGTLDPSCAVLVEIVCPVPAVLAGCIGPNTIESCQPPVFHRGDANGDGEIEISDAILILSFLFLGGTAPGCLDAADAQDNGVLEITDGVKILGYLFLGGPPPELPGPPPLPCGVDPTADELDCASYPSC